MMLGLGLGGLGLRRGAEMAAAPPPEPEPVTVAFPSAQVARGFYGPLDTVTNAARLYIAAGTSVWFGRIRGSTATLNCLNPLTSTTLAPFSVSVDGAAYGDVHSVSGVATLFTGLTDDWHLVSIRPGAAFGTSIYLPQTGTLMTVTGLAPDIDVMANKVQTGGPGVLSGGPTGTAVAHVNFAPRVLGVGSDTSVGQGVNALAVRTAATRLHIVTESTYVAVSIDGAAPTYYTKLLNQGVIVPCDGGSHDYYIWCNGVSGGSSNYDAFGIGADATISSIGTKRLHHFGHSIVHGIAATSTAHTDMARTAARKGYLFGNMGVSGNTIQTLLARMTATLARLTVTTADVAILDIGRNDGQAGFDAADDTDFPVLLSALVAKGYGKILVLGQMTEPGNFLSEGAGRLNEDMAAAVAATGNPAILYLSRASYTGIAKTDGVHPSDAGYVTMDGLNMALIDPVLAP